MNFKNISLFSLLFVTSCVGAILYAQDEDESSETMDYAIAVKMDLKKKLGYKEQELKGLLALAKVYNKIGRSLARDCFEEGGLTRRDKTEMIESCMSYQLNGLEWQKIWDKVNEISLEIDDIKAEIDSALYEEK